MEKSIDSFVEYLKEEFQLEDQDLRTYSPADTGIHRRFYF